MCGIAKIQRARTDAVHRALKGEGLFEVNDMPDVDRTARTIAENVYAAYSRQAEGTIPPQSEQTLMVRLVEAIREEVPGGKPRDILDAANTVLDVWEQNAQIRGPRISALDRADGSVAMASVGSFSYEAGLRDAKNRLKS
ncbi:hypothetical protein [Methylobacterium cerastii]|uniref:hypothetical protein n=1 Tax=Methylobacterium cerastii TaxID=932741 RepID=UPI001EE22AAB|nr:hypothetical protein [Methylobacterium cerastii]